MTIQFFLRLKDLTGSAAIDYKIDGETTVCSLLASLYRDFPELEKWDAHILVAVGVEYVGRDYVLNNSDVVSIMPPVQGG